MVGVSGISSAASFLVVMGFDQTEGLFCTCACNSGFIDVNCS